MTSRFNPQTVAEALGQTVEAYPDRTAYIDQGESYSWRQIDGLVQAWAQQLHALGVGKGDRIAVILPNGLPWVLSYLACAGLGAVLVGLSVRYRQTELDFILADSEVKAVLAPREFAGFDFVSYLGQAQQRLGKLKHLIWIEPDFVQNLVPAVGENEQLAGPAPDDLLMIIYTSGTTGRPKAAGLSHRSQLASALAQREHVKASVDDLVQLAMPLNHVGGITCGI